MLKIEEMPESLREECVKHGISEKEIKESIDKLNNLSMEKYLELAKETTKYLEECFEIDKENRLNQQIEYLKKNHPGSCLKCFK